MFVTLQSIGEHQQCVHENENEKQLLETNQNNKREHTSDSIQCPICQRRFVDRTRLQRHVAAAHSTRTHTCATCAATFR
jgi:hypothetical protein